MKFLENEKLIELTGQLAEAVLGQSHRIIDGRIEAYTMKRAGNDKKFAHTLGQKFIADLEEQQQLLNDLTQVAASRRAQNHATYHGKRLEASKKEDKGKARQRKRSNSEISFLQTVSKKKPRSLGGRTRSHSVDLTMHTNKNTLGDISELATRRLMTDLILTLNASFQDYDFSNAKPQQFEKLSLARVQRSISERLSELATLRKLNRSHGVTGGNLGGLPVGTSDLVVEIFSALDSVVNLKECDIYTFEDESFLDESDHLWSFHYFFVNKSLRRLVFFTCSEHIDERRHQPVEGDGEETEVMMPSELHMGENTEFDSAFSGMSVPIYSII